MEFLRTVVIDENVKREHVLDGSDGEMLLQERGHGGVVEREDGDGEATVDFAGEMCD